MADPYNMFSGLVDQYIHVVNQWLDLENMFSRLVDQYIHISWLISPEFSIWGI